MTDKTKETILSGWRRPDGRTLLIASGMLGVSIVVGGYLLGDEGSAYWLGHAAVRRGIRAADGRGPETQLGPRILERLELERPQDLVAWFYDQESSRSRVAGLAPVVEEAADVRAGPRRLRW